MRDDRHRICRAVRAATPLIALMVGVLACALAACDADVSRGRSLAPASGAPSSEGRYVNGTPSPKPAPWTERAGLWMRKVATSLSPRPGWAQRVDVDLGAVKDSPSLTWIGHATFLVRMDGVTFLTDPMFLDWASPLPRIGPKRGLPPGMSLEQLPRIDFVFISHDHHDHADLPSIRWLAARGARFVVPMGVGLLVREAGGTAVELDWWQHVDIGPVRVHSVPAQHHSGRGLGGVGQSLWSGVVVQGATRTFYHAGDTGYAENLAVIGQRFGAIDLAVVPIGAYDTPSPGPYLHATPEEALQLGLDVRARRIVAMHFGTFDLSDEPLDEPPRRFRAAALAQGLDANRVWMLRIGETRRW